MFLESSAAFDTVGLRPKFARMSSFGSREVGSRKALAIIRRIFVCCAAVSLATAGFLFVVGRIPFWFVWRENVGLSSWRELPHCGVKWKRIARISLFQGTEVAGRVSFVVFGGGAPASSLFG